MTEDDIRMDDRGANLLGALAVGLEDAVRAALVDEVGLDVTAVAALLIIRERPGRPIADLATALGLTHSGAVRALDRLVDHDLVTRDAGPDGRSLGLVLTDAGRAVTDRALAARRAVLGRLVATLPTDQQRGLVTAVEGLLAQLPGNRHDAWRICRTCEHDVCRGRNCPVGSAVDPADTGTHRGTPRSRRR
jgi:DNA-binding MarR family transcriptional regulator